MHQQISFTTMITDNINANEKIYMVLNDPIDGNKIHIKPKNLTLSKTIKLKSSTKI